MFAKDRQKNLLFVVGHRSAVSFTIASDARRRSCIKYDSRGDVPRSNAGEPDVLSVGFKSFALLKF